MVSEGKEGPVYDAEAEVAAVQSANAEYDKAYEKAHHAFKKAVDEAQQRMDAELANARQKRDRQYAEAHRAYHEHQLQAGDMSDEARNLLRRQLNEEVTWDSSLGEVRELSVSDVAKGHDSGR